MGTHMNDENERKRQEELVDRWMRNVRDSKTLMPAADAPNFDSPDWWKPEEANPEVEAAISGFRLSETALQSLGDDPGRAPSGNGIELPLDEVLKLLPANYVDSDAASRAQPGETISVVIEDLFEQLAAGCVRVCVARLVFGVPAGIVSSVALRDDETIVTLPLPLVVEALGTQRFAERTAPQEQGYDIDAFPALFEGESAADKAQDTAEDKAQDKAEDKAEEPVAPPQEPVPVSEEPAPAPAEPEPAFQGEVGSVNGVDLNSATIEQLMTLDGVSRNLARDIIAFRAVHGPLQDVFDLGRVPGLGRQRFRRITGMPFSRVKRHRHETLARLLGVPHRSLGHLPTIADAIGVRPGLTGCVISDKDGLLLASTGVDEQAQILSAILPRMLRQIRENMAEMADADIESASISLDGRMFTVIDGGDIYLSVIHASNRLTAGLLKFARRVARELAWFLSYRGYVGAPAASESGAQNA